MTKKIKNVLTPYLVLSAAPIIYFVFFKEMGPRIYTDYIFLQKEGVYYHYLRPIVLFLWTGATMTAYWYIPFIMIIFLISPVFIAYIELRAARRLVILGILLIVAALIHRPVLNLYPLQSVVYFSSVYAYGILCSIYKNKIYDYLKGKEVFLLLVILLLASLQVILFDHYGNFHKSPFIITCPDLLLLQKMIMCLFFMLFFHRFENKNFTILNYLASASFAIYFLHPYLMWILFRLFLSPMDLMQFSGGLLWIIIFPIVVVTSMVTGRIIKAIFSSHSRQIVGW